MHALFLILLLSSIVAVIGFLLCWIVTAPFKALSRAAGRRREEREIAIKLANMKPEVRDAINAAAFKQFYGMPSIPWTRIKGSISPITLTSLLQGGLVYKSHESGGHKYRMLHYRRTRESYDRYPETQATSPLAVRRSAVTAPTD
jgi:hypothetical protein